MGLPGSGKTTLATELFNKLRPNCLWLNADRIREQYNDWDFSLEGRIRQAQRMRDLADSSSADNEFVICDFVAPLEKMRTIFDADLTVWVDTICFSRFEDTNKLFEIPDVHNVSFIHVIDQDAIKWADIIYNELSFIKPTYEN